MKYIRKIPTADKEVSAKLVADGWTKLKEPSNLGLTILLSVPFMIINGVIFAVIAYYLYPPLKEFFNIKNDLNITFTVNLSTLLYVVMFFIFMTIHEFLHASFIPKAFTSDKVYWGINGFVGFVYTTEKIKKERYLTISIMPFIILSIILPFILSILGWLNWFTLFLCLMNAMGASVDFLNMCLIVVQVPRGSEIINNGFETYFRKNNTTRLRL